MPRLTNLHQIAGNAFRFDGDRGIKHQAFQFVMSGAMEQVRASEGERVTQNRCPSLPGCAVDDQRPYEGVHFRAVIRAKDVLGGNSVSRYQARNDTHADFVAALEEGMARGFGYVLPEYWQREDKQHE